eukprot:TRINITY_DN6874_c0_g1_i1.p1 TRINITY_DN6874_c0_g1~~TRINITY_DN6874_c0_g1_i1.p1  ORF type:complete len:331 (+),score=37.84 TRINITY_DN6874_c0_g1_i1:50-994(+)
MHRFGLLLLTGTLAAAITDTHVHFANLQLFNYSQNWVHTSHHPIDYVSDSSDMNKLGTVNDIVFMQASVVTSEAVNEVSWVSSMFSNSTTKPRVNLGAIVGYASVENGAEVEDEILQLLSASGGKLRGIRRILDPIDDDYCWFTKNPKFSEGLAVVAKHGLLFELLTRSGEQFNCTYDFFANQAPKNLTVVLQHLGNPNMTIPGDKANFDNWLSYISRMSSLPNTVLKVSGVPERAALGWNSFSQGQVQPFLEAAITHFGYKRSFFGGNWFVVTTFSTYSRWSQILDSVLTDLHCTQDDRTALLTDNAKRIYNF